MAKSSVIFDSNVWIAYFHTNDAHHAKAVTAIKTYQADTIVLTEYVLLEIATLLKQKIGPQQTSALLSALLQTSNIELLPSSSFFAETLATFQSSTECHLSFVDVSLLVLSTDFNVVTFDTKLHNAIAKL